MHGQIKRVLVTIGAGCLFVLAGFAVQSFAPTPALADGSACWCRTQAWVCTHYSAAQVVSGGSSGGDITDAQCRSYCLERQSNFLIAETYSRSTCTRCVEGSSCSTVADSGLTNLTPVQQTCIIKNSAMRPDVPSLEECCALNREAGVQPQTVGYSGTTQNCPAAQEPAAQAVSSSGPIRLYNPLGSETDIPAFIGRGIRGVLGVIGAIALLMFIYGGIVWMTAGDSKRIDDAKNIIKNSVIGLLLIFFAYNLIGIFFDFFSP